MTGTARASRASRIATSAIAAPNGNTIVPSAAQTAKYATPTITISQPARAELMCVPNELLKCSNDGVSDGSIIATIMNVHIPANEAVAPNHDCPGINIHMCDIVHPPGICIWPIADIEALVAIVIAALATKTIAETLSRIRREATGHSR